MSTEKPSQLEETLFEFAPDAILLVGARGRILRVNPQAELLFGYSAKEIEGELIEVLIPERFRARHVGLRDGYSEAPRPRRMAASQELWARHKNGREIAVEVALGPQRSNQGSSVVCIVRDITERQMAQKALQKAHDELEHRVDVRTQELSEANAALARSNRELQDFAYVASHDLQEPLRKIQAFGERLTTQVAGLDDTAKDYLGRMQNAAARMQRLIQDLLAFSRVTTKAAPFETVSLDQILSEVLSDLEVRIEETGAKIEAERPLATVQGDPTQFRQLLQNLLGNALKFRDPSRAHVVRIAGRLLKDEATRKDWYELEISDNGIGFEPRFTERIFGLFQRLHSRDDYEGSGVGLAICRKIADRHGGRLTAVGRPGAGATFTVVLPVKRG